MVRVQVLLSRSFAVAWPKGCKYKTSCSSGLCRKSPRCRVEVAVITTPARRVMLLCSFLAGRSFTYSSYFSIFVHLHLSKSCVTSRNPHVPNLNSTVCCGYFCAKKVTVRTTLGQVETPLSVIGSMTVPSLVVGAAANNSAVKRPGFRSSDDVDLPIMLNPTCLVLPVGNQW